MRRALLALDSGPEAIALVESQLIGTLMVCPALRQHCNALRQEDFSTSHRGAAFSAIMRLSCPEVGLVALDLEETPPPPRCTGWGDALGRLLDVAFVEDEVIPEAVRAIKDAAIERRAEARRRRQDAA